MSLDHALLALLHTPASGWDLKKQFDGSVGHFWPADLAQIYPTLKRMTARGWLTMELGPSQRGPARRVYSRSAAGLAELARWAAGPPQLGSERFAFLVQLWALGETGDAATSLDFLARLRERLVAWKVALDGMDAHWRGSDPRVPDGLTGAELHAHLCLRFGMTALDAKLAWCDEALSRIAAAAENGDPVA